MSREIIRRMPSKSEYWIKDNGGKRKLHDGKNGLKKRVNNDSLGKGHQTEMALNAVSPVDTPKESRQRPLAVRSVLHQCHWL